MVGPEDTAAGMGNDPEVVVLATPRLLLLVEEACYTAVKPALEVGERLVGRSVQLKHLAPTPIGKQAWAVAELIEVDGKKLRFKVEAFDEDKQIGVGTHRRAVVRIAE